MDKSAENALLVNKVFEVLKCPIVCGIYAELKYKKLKNIKIVGLDEVVDYTYPLNDDQKNADPTHAILLVGITKLKVDVYKSKDNSIPSLLIGDIAYLFKDVSENRNYFN